MRGRRVGLTVFSSWVQACHDWALGTGLEPSIVAAFLLEPGLGPLRLATGGASDEGVLVPFMVVESMGVSAGVGWLMFGAGVSDGDEDGFDSWGAAGNDSWGNLDSASRDSLSVMVSAPFLAVVDMFVVGRRGKGVGGRAAMDPTSGRAGSVWAKWRVRVRIARQLMGITVGWLRQ